MPYMMNDVQGMPPSWAQMQAMARGIQGGVYSPPGGSAQPTPQGAPAPMPAPPQGGPGGPQGSMPAPMSILGGGASAPMPPGALSDRQRGFAGMLEDNSNALLQGGMSALSGRGVLPGFQQGMAVDAKQKTDRDTKAAKEKAIASLKKLYPQHAEIIDGLNDPQQALRHITEQNNQAREQANADRNYKLNERAADRADAQAKEPKYQIVDGAIVQIPDGGGTPKEVYRSTTSGETAEIKTIRGREAYAIEKGLDPKEPRVASWIRTGNELKDTNKQITAGDRQAIRGFQTQQADVTDTLANLNELEKLNTEVPEGWMAKQAAGIRNTLGMSTPESQKLTRFNQLIGQEAVTKMSATLKGATTDKEMAEFQRIVGDSSLPAATRLAAITAIKRKAAAHLQLLKDQEYEARGGDYSLEGQQKRAAEGGWTDLGDNVKIRQVK